MSAALKVVRALREPRLAVGFIRRQVKSNYLWPYWLRVVSGALLPPYVRTSRFRSLYVLTYGRSGSTLLTGYLSMLPGIRLRGENYLFPLPLAEADERMRHLSNLSYGNREKTASPWYGSQLVSYARWRRDVRHAVLNQLYPRQPFPRTLGFKEIRWWYRLPADRFDAILGWLVALFPPGGIVVLTRDLDRVMAGAWWKELSDDERAHQRSQLEAFEERALEYVRQHPDHAHAVTYEAFTSDPECAKGLTEFLGLRWHEKTWRAALEQQFSYKSSPTSTEAGSGL